MAKEDKGKIRLIVFELEGSNETLQEGMKTVLKAMGAASPPRPNHSLPPPAGGSIASNGTTDLPDLDSVDTQNDYTDDNEAAKTTKPAAKKTAKAKYPTPNVIDIDLTSGDVPFKEFYDKKKPTENTKRYLVVAAWLKQYRNIDVVTIDHIYTCYRLLNLNVPADVGQVMRSLKKQGWMNAASTRGSFTINHVGLNQVNDMGGGL